MHEPLMRIEDYPKPIVMAIHGTALGGGNELAMAGHYRIASPDAQIGQPEVNLGNHSRRRGNAAPARIVGIAAAIDLCVQAVQSKAPAAKEIGLVDELVSGDLKEGAIAFARRLRPARTARHVITRNSSATLWAKRAAVCRGPRAGPQDSPQPDCAAPGH